MAALIFPMMVASAGAFGFAQARPFDFAQARPFDSAQVGSLIPGRDVYDEQCSRCHGPEGREGKAPWLVPFRWNVQQALNIIRSGGACGMPAFPESELSDEQVKQIVDYLKSLE